MPVQHSPPERQTRSQARAQAVLTPTPRAPFYGTPAVPQLRAHLDRGLNLEGEAPSRKEGGGPIRSNGEEEEEKSDGTEGVPSPMGASHGTGGPTLAQSNHPVSQQSKPFLLAIMQQMTHTMADIQALIPPAFNTPSMKALECCKVWM
ncbi:hypothetical protein O181_078056 [Austropuccinia psidii MF-1]|uniref:Uncharacterized protein n=1 Tax=Austropuccinia psidii MF-1 TaxID=1389203 RepID=A0A9Q3FJ96_9BASI|nr:hypothetical protein [Austropuccinia psidii MF-1]